MAGVQIQHLFRPSDSTSRQVDRFVTEQLATPLDREQVDV
jgi:hypothetical protein